MILVIVCLGCRLCGQEPTCTRTVPVSILDANGAVPQNLTGDAWIARLGQNPLEIMRARLYSGPTRVSILIDNSASMRKGVYASGKADLAYWVAADAINRLPANVSMAVLEFNEHVEGPLDFSMSRQQLATEISRREKSAKTSPHGKTALMDAVKYVLDHFPDHAAPGDSIYVVTDGQDNASDIGVSKLERQLDAAGVRLSVFLMRDFVFTGDPAPGTDEVITLARATGGTVIEIHPKIHGTGTSGTTENFHIPEERQRIISDQLTLLYRQTVRPYLLDVMLPSAMNKPYRWKLEMADEQRRKSTHMFYPNEIVPCESAPRVH